MTGLIYVKARRRFADDDSAPRAMHTPHPLAVPAGVTNARQLADCGTCLARLDCMRSVRKLGPFADAACEQALREYDAPPPNPQGANMQRVAQANAQRIMAGLWEYGPHTAVELAPLVGMVVYTVREHLRRLEAAGRLVIVDYRRSRPNSHPAAVYAVKEETA